MKRFQFTILALAFALVVKFLFQYLISEEPIETALTLFNDLFSGVSFGIFEAFELESTSRGQTVALSNALSIAISAIMLNLFVLYVPLVPKKDTSILKNITALQTVSLVIGWGIMILGAFWFTPFMEMSSDGRSGSLADTLILLMGALDEYWMLVNVLFLVISAVVFDFFRAIIQSKRG